MVFFVAGFTVYYTLLDGMQFDSYLVRHISLLICLNINFSLKCIQWDSGINRLAGRMDRM
jgi:hypothetical protein